MRHRVAKRADLIKFVTQCEDLFRLWAGEGQDARFLLLSPDGRPPRQVHTDEARNAWRTLSYRSLSDWLEQNLPMSLTTTAHQSVRLYADSLRHTFGSGSGFAVGRSMLDDPAGTQLRVTDG